MQYTDIHFSSFITACCLIHGQFFHVSCFSYGPCANNIHAAVLEMVDVFPEVSTQPWA